MGVGTNLSRNELDQLDNMVSPGPRLAVTDCSDILAGGEQRDGVL